MQLGMIGLGRMVANMVRRLMRGGHECVVWDVNPDNVKQLADEGATGAQSLDDFVSKLSQPRAVWITVEECYLYCGPSGAGHFVKMVHNGIEYGLMQAYAEGFDIFHNANSKDLPEELRYDLNVADIAEVWRRGSVISSWLLDLTAMALLEDRDLVNYSGFVQDSG